ncbi:hypothetical protein COY65_02340 [Candidatus Jorgensenbacteria bacterium CG_4_10_14_0_8_um_filter_39_13]|uniref:Uncharacterized protein n=2 Tax=Candidatus Joergenseniibacteriota TaxID=1752739 RepID=A0A2M7RGB1_9BACT|nr:MAG: hypothetical protein COV54_02555 [Candidatus Jorgensenbacteria bacterium CG11_big_fil_rev_8_21_14_0_20_38_23]PIV12930.1 MAG: hypothetical protein COS46_02895 [Candidatus Jorgensenbacteria bacterium CG03_land_8_20_14_0_80_38_39]PIW97559.1 MAG: hypothetical protein COZ81_01940 [Candidatus Jorgensenbacteria bacterium CG_4_8_14_3_um_filter_38_10]PIY95795.1 MAG: hypothetical protein COY65_02340 [Candidatus Jorgensenbacteria bacterium CG_4_10_14_0_8_um_filter_39_13]PJA94740.1 MAG: hypothetica
MKLQPFLKTFLILAIGIGLLPVTNLGRAQTPFLQNALKNVQEGVDELTNVKNENSRESFNSRVETFKEVLNLSLSEMENIKLRLLSLDNLTKKGLVLREEMISWFDKILKFYNSQKQDLKKLENDENATINDIKNLAQKFKEWRETDYLPKIDEIYNFILINLEKEAVQMAQNRFQKISRSLNQLKENNVKNLDGVFELLDKTKKIIQEGNELNQKSEDLFWQFLTPSLIEKNSSTSPTSSGEVSSTEINFLNSTSSNVSSSTTMTEEINPPSPSIKDLTKESLNKIKEAYQIFIEISNLVRKLLI